MKKAFLIYLEPKFKSKIDVFLAQIGPAKNYSFSKYVELSLRLANAIVQSNTIPDDLGIILQNKDPEALAELQDILKAKKLAKAVG